MKTSQALCMYTCMHVLYTCMMAFLMMAFAWTKFLHGKSKHAKTNGTWLEYLRLVSAKIHEAPYCIAAVFVSRHSRFSVSKPQPTPHTTTCTHNLKHNAIKVVYVATCVCMSSVPLMVAIYMYRCTPFSLNLAIGMMCV